MAVLNAVRRNPWLRQHHERLRAASKPGKIVVIAAMRKLLSAVWSVATHRRPFVPHLPRVPAPLGAVTTGLMNSTKASGFYPERPSAQLICFRDFEVRNVGTSSLR
jgi:hypothetical protein